MFRLFLHPIRMSTFSMTQRYHVLYLRFVRISLRLILIISQSVTFVKYYLLARFRQSFNTFLFGTSLLIIHYFNTQVFQPYIIYNIFNSFPHSSLGLFHPSFVVIIALGVMSFRQIYSAYYYTPSHKNLRVLATVSPNSPSFFV